MSLSATVAPHLPDLRRLARALTGSQAAGDAYAMATLEAIAAEQAALRTELEPRVALYHVFLKIWRSVPLNEKPTELLGGSGALEAASRSLDAITPLPRVAFLLSFVEGFSPAQVASALDIEVAEVRTLIDRAGREISEQIRTDVLIIEDEPIIAMDLEALVEELGHRVVNIARTQDEALAIVAAERPGLILADIQLADGSSGLDTVNDILETFDVPVIFITAYPERFLTGERPEPAFLIPKPFRPETVKGIISQALFFDRKARRSRAGEDGTTAGSATISA